MAKKKIYAVKKGKNPGIYENWPDCEAQVAGVSGAQFKSFFTLKEAEDYISNSGENAPLSVAQFNSLAEKRIAELSEDEAVAFVDGSYDDDEKKSAFAAVIFARNSKDVLSKSFAENSCGDLINFRNIAPELEAVKEAVRWAIERGKKKIAVYYDYSGIENWTNGAWRAKKSVTKEYAAFIKESKEKIEIEFVKVPAHSGIKYNEEADKAAKSALRSKNQ